MTSVESSLRLITEPAYKKLHRRAGMAALFEIPPPNISLALLNFDEIVTSYNALSSEAPYDLRFVPKVKEVRPVLPRVSELITKGSINDCIAFRQSLRTMNLLMARAEQGEQEPNLGFATWQQAGITDADRLLGGVTNAYALTLAHHRRGLKSVHIKEDATFYQEKDNLLDALLEVAAIEHGAEQADSPLYELAMKMGWYDARAEGSDKYLFTDNIRSLAAV